MLLRRYREQRGWTRAEMAQKAGMSHQYIAALESGARRQPSLGVLNALADALELGPPERAEFILSFALRPVQGEASTSAPAGALPAA
jgi:transcriptional regulator with XRE-family HTH domain